MKYPDITAIYSTFKQSKGIVTDSRKITTGSVFFALRGKNFNGNEFAEQSIRNGAAAAVIDDAEFYSGEPFILVENVLFCLQQLAAMHRTHLKIPFLAITGSNGKTTTKELIRAVLSKKFNVFATHGNLNNHIGVPISVLSVSAETEIAVIEMGASHTGEITALCKIAKPDYGIITNISKAHIGEFGSFEKIIEAKSELYRFVKEHNGKVFVNAGNELLMKLSENITSVTYGSSENCFSFCKLVEANPLLKIQFENEIISTQMPGAYNFENAAAAICIGKYFSVETQKIKQALETYVPSENRSQILKTPKRTILLDAYNANPASMTAALENFVRMNSGSKTVILGDMLELGSHEAAEHQKILKAISSETFQKIILVGKRFRKAASDLKFLHGQLFLFDDVNELIARLQSEKNFVNSSLVLLKGSRAMQLEKVKEWL